MTGGLEAAGDMLTGGVIARAVESKHGEATAHAHGLCLNCGTRLDGPYCHRCGQAAHVHRTLTGLWHDIAHGVFHFEGKVWRTLPMLAWRPGALTRRYTHGERARFVSPLALFLFCVFLMFAIFSTVGGPVPMGGDAAMRADVTRDLAAADAEVKRLVDLRAAAARRGDSLAGLDARLAEAQSDRNRLVNARRIVTGEAIIVDDKDFTFDTGSPAFDARVRAALKDPKLLLYKLQSNAYKFAWALIPLSLPFMWAMFAWRRQYRLYDHAVFVTYSLSFTMLLLIAMALLLAVGASDLSGWLTLLLPLHFYRQLKGAYELSRFSAIWRTAVLIFVSLLVLTAFGLFLLALGVSG